MLVLQEKLGLGVRGEVDLNVVAPLLQSDARFLQPLVKSCGTISLEGLVQLIVRDTLLVKANRQLFGTSFAHLSDVLL